MRPGDAHPRPPAPRTFACFTTGHPDRIWTALTDPTLTRRYLYGLELRSDWVPGSNIEVVLRDEACLGGQVLCVQTGRRLSYLLCSSDDDPAIYVTWLLRPCGDGTVVTLQLDDLDVAEGNADSCSEDVWLPVLAALQDAIADR